MSARHIRDNKESRKKGEGEAWRNLNDGTLIKQIPKARKRRRGNDRMYRKESPGETTKGQKLAEEKKSTTGKETTKAETAGQTNKKRRNSRKRWNYNRIRNEGDAKESA